MHYLTHYVIDWDKVQSLDDIKRLLAAMRITFEPNCASLDAIHDLVRSEPKASIGMVPL